jgi:hypothetical protein
MLRPGHEVTVYCDAPVPTKGLPDKAIPELAEHVRSVMARRVDDYWAARGWTPPPRGASAPEHAEEAP